jgi:hypothetical protein
MSHHILHREYIWAKNIDDIVGALTSAEAVTATKALRNLVLTAEEKRCERAVGWIPQIYFLGTLKSQIGTPRDSSEFFAQPKRYSQV